VRAASSANPDGVQRRGPGLFQDAPIPARLSISTDASDSTPLSPRCFRGGRLTLPSYRPDSSASRSSRLVPSHVPIPAIFPLRESLVRQQRITLTGRVHFFSDASARSVPAIRWQNASGHANTDVTSR
jgi:hypothetical protein